MSSIAFPNPPLYWITWEDNTETTVQGYGFVNTEERLDTINHLTSYVDEVVWKSVLLQHGIDPDPEEEEE
jgi:glycerol-3-phosphate cytidylyltransferase-like family protein